MISLGIPLSFNACVNFTQEVGGVCGSRHKTPRCKGRKPPYEPQRTGDHLHTMCTAFVHQSLPQVRRNSHTRCSLSFHCWEQVPWLFQMIIIINWYLLGAPWVYVIGGLIGYHTTNVWLQIILELLLSYCRTNFVGLSPFCMFVLKCHLCESKQGLELEF